jgi:hypothetical protein
MDNRLFMNFGNFEQNIGLQNANADGKVTEVGDHVANVSRLEVSWRSDDFRGALEALRQHENRVTENAQIQHDLARRGGVTLGDGMETAKFSQAAVQGLMGA